MSQITPTILEIREYLLTLVGEQYHSDSLRESMVATISDWFDRGIAAAQRSEYAPPTERELHRNQDEVSYLQDEGDWQLRPSEAGGDLE